jgi:uncharacterized protein (TIGR00369 family)
MTSSASALSLAEFTELATVGVPLIGLLGCTIEQLDHGICVVRLPYRPLLLRPGGTLSGPALMALADICLYGTVLSAIGRVELAVTTDISIRFLERPRPGDLLARGRLLKLGRRLAIGEVTISPAAPAAPVAHATGTYALPAAPRAPADDAGS